MAPHCLSYGIDISPRMEFSFQAEGTRSAGPIHVNLYIFQHITSIGLRTKFRPYCECRIATIRCSESRSSGSRPTCRMPFLLPRCLLFFLSPLIFRQSEHLTLDSRWKRLHRIPSADQRYGSIKYPNRVGRSGHLTSTNSRLDR